MAGTPPDWIPGPERTLLHTPIFDVRAVQYRHPHRERTAEFVRIDAADWVVAVAVTPADELVLVRQFRFGTAATSLELPGGVIDRAETPVQAAVRELGEETGFVGRDARVLGWTHPNPAIQGNRNHIVLIEGAERQGQPAWDEHEELATEVWPVADVIGAVVDGRITHALMVNALLLYDLHRRRAGADGAGAI